MELARFAGVACWIAAVVSATPLAPAMFTFGDSYVDVGTNMFVTGVPTVANSPPYGETFFYKPTGRFSNGKIASDFLASYLGLQLQSPFLKPGSNFSQGANLASAGSGILDTTNANKDLVPLRAQARQFQELTTRYGSSGPNISSSIFLISTGTNDLLGGYLFNASAQHAYNPQQYVDLLVARYREFLLSLYRSGARKIVIAGMTPLGCTPQLRLLESAVHNATGCYEDSNKLALDLNNRLEELLFQNLTRELALAKLVLVNPYDFLIEVMSNGSRFGFDVTDANCCGSGRYNAGVSCGTKVPFLCYRPSKYLFWDFHPTHHAAMILSSKIWSGGVPFVQPMNLHTLVQSF